MNLSRYASLLLCLTAAVGLSPKLIAQDAAWRYVGDLGVYLSEPVFGSCGEIYAESGDRVYVSDDTARTWRLAFAPRDGVSYVALLRTSTGLRLRIRDGDKSFIHPLGCDKDFGDVVEVREPYPCAGRDYELNAVYSVGGRDYVVGFDSIRPDGAVARRLVPIDRGRFTDTLGGPGPTYALSEFAVGGAPSLHFAGWPFRVDTVQPRFDKPVGTAELIYSNTVSLSVVETLVTVWRRANSEEGFVFARRVLPKGEWEIQQIDAGRIVSIQDEGAPSLAIVLKNRVWFSADARLLSLKPTLIFPQGFTPKRYNFNLNSDGLSAVSVAGFREFSIVSTEGIYSSIGALDVDGVQALLVTQENELLAMESANVWYSFGEASPGTAPSRLNLADGITIRSDTVGANVYRLVLDGASGILLRDSVGRTDTVARGVDYATYRLLGDGPTTRIVAGIYDNQVLENNTLRDPPGKLRLFTLDIIGTDTLIISSRRIVLGSDPAGTPLTFPKLPTDAVAVPRVYQHHGMFYVAFLPRSYSPVHTRLWAYTVDPKTRDVTLVAGGSSRSYTFPTLIQLEDAVHIARGSQSPTGFTGAWGVPGLPTRTYFGGVADCRRRGAEEPLLSVAYGSGFRSFARLDDRLVIAGDNGIFISEAACVPPALERREVCITLGDSLDVGGYVVRSSGAYLGADSLGVFCEAPVQYEVFVDGETLADTTNYSVCIGPMITVNSKSLGFTEPGTYTVRDTIKNQVLGCRYFRTATVEVSVTDTLRRDTVARLGDTIYGIRVEGIGQEIGTYRRVDGTECRGYVLLTVTRVVDVEAFAELQFTRVYPNPVTSTLRIDGLLTDGVATMIVVRDLLGRVVVPMQTSAGVDEVSLDLSMLAGGVYLVQVTRPEGSRVWKVQRE